MPGDELGTKKDNISCSGTIGILIGNPVCIRISQYYSRRGGSMETQAMLWCTYK